MKGIILAGGSGTRLRPMTNTLSKQVLPIYDKPMIFYPLTTLMLASIRDILIISTPRDLPAIEGLLGDGSALGLSLQYKVQPKPEGIAQAFIIGEEFIGDEAVCLILGDNIFYGEGLRPLLDECSAKKTGATIVACRVQDPQRYGVVSYDRQFKPISIVEKPKKPESNWAVTGLYFYDAGVVDIAKRLKPSARGELEITDVNNAYIKQYALQLKRMSRGMAWLDAGTPDSLLDASNFIQTIEKRQGMKIACIEEIAHHMGFIDDAQLARLADDYGDAPYGNYLRHIIHYDGLRG